MTPRLAVPADAGGIAQLRADLRLWLASIGSDQWSTTPTDWTDRIADDIVAGNTWIVPGDNAGVVVATITANGWTDAGLWSPAEIETARFVHRMMVSRTAGHSGLGAELLDHVGQIGARQGYPWLRLDAWTTNTRLHRYYQSVGFRHVRTVEGHRTPSAVLFERATGGDAAKI